MGHDGPHLVTSDDTLRCLLFILAKKVTPIGFHIHQSYDATFALHLEYPHRAQCYLNARAFSFRSPRSFRYG